MVEKPFSVLIYVLGGLLLATWPIIAQWASRNENGVICSWYRRSAQWASENGFPKLVFPYGWLAGASCGLLVGSTLPWWRPKYSDISIQEGVVYGIIVCLSLFPMTRGLRSTPLLEQNAALERRPILKWMLLIIAILTSAVMSFSTGIFAQPWVLLFAWHHWSAYIGPSELMLAGARIFHDFSAQYGLGPTFLVAASCGDNCWLGMHYVVASTTLLFALAVLCVVASANIRSAAAYGIVLAAALVACFLWNAYPPLASSPRVAPSVSGLRFLPAIALVLGVIWIERHPRLAPHWAKLGHVAYGIGALWSPESLFFVGFVWWPYYCWRRCAEAEPSRFLTSLLRSIAVLLLVSIAILSSFLVTYRLLYGLYPSIDAYVAYMLYTPGVLPIDPMGPIWFSVASLALGFLSVSQILLARRSRADLHRHTLVLLLGYATLSYCMGRSHSNNFLNVVPFSALILVNILASRRQILMKGMAAGMIVSLLGWMSVFGWSSWAATIEARQVFEFRPRQVVASFSYENPVAAAAVTEYFNASSAVDDFANISHALSAIRATSQDPISVIDDKYLLLPSSPPRVWSAYNGPGNFYFMPREWRQEFLRNTAGRLRQSGWLIIRRDYPKEWTEDFDLVYDVTEELDFNTYRALHFAPRNTGR